MADPVIQSFCCVNIAKKTNPAFYAMMEFNSTPYNLVCFVSSVIGVIGALYQVAPKDDSKRRHRSASLVCARGRKIIYWLAVADLFATVGVLLRSIVNLDDGLVKVLWTSGYGNIFCSWISAWIQYWYSVTWLWTLCYTIDVGLAFQDKPGYQRIYHLFCWVVPAVFTGGGLIYLYFPNEACLQVSSILFIHVVLNYLTTYLPMLTVMLANPVLYCFVARHVRRVVYQGLSQYTNKEREVVDSTYLTFTLVNVFFYLVWFPNLLSTILIWIPSEEVPVQLLLVLWYLMAILNPLQAFLNCLVYNRFSEKMNVPWALVSPEGWMYETTPLLTNSQRNKLTRQNSGVTTAYRSDDQSSQ